MGNNPFNGADTSVGDCEAGCETDQGLHIAPCSECDFWYAYESLWQTGFGLFCEECFHEQVSITGAVLNRTYRYERKQTDES